MLRIALLAALLLLAPLTPTVAQDGSRPHGSVTTGYRFTDVNGSRQTFSELFDLRSGLRLHDFDVSGDAAAANPYLSSYFITASGIGGEPFTGGQLRLNKKNLYDFRLNYRQTYFYWNRNDDDLHPGGLRGLTTNHDWATVRKFGSASLSLYATDNLRLNLDFYRTEREGMTLTTRSLDYFGAPSTWANFLRANPYVVESDLNESTHRFSGGLSYSAKNWNVFHRAGYQTYDENLLTGNLAAAQRSINTDDAATANELLSIASWSEFRRLKAPLSETSYNGRISPRVRLRGGYIFYGYAGPAALNASFAGVARTSSATVLSPYAASVNERISVEEHNHIIDQGLTVEIYSGMSLHADYRYSLFTINSLGSFESVQNPITLARGETGIDWEQNVHNLDVAFEVAPGPGLLVRPGIRLMKRDVTMREDEVINPQAGRPSKLVSPIFTVYYSPSGRFSLRGDIQNTTNDGPYTRISPRTDLNARFVARYQPSSQVSIENNLKLRNSKYTTTSYENIIRSNAATIRYAPHKRFSAFGSFAYDSFLATASISFLRGTAPLSTTWRDQTINRIWQGGFEVNPIDPFTLMFSGNYERTTGVGEISGEPPISGPLRWPFATATAAYNFPLIGKVSLDLHRTYYVEEIMRGNNFSANILGIRWTRDF